MKNIILLGAPGSGKGTQSENLMHELKYTHISTGDIIRDNIKNGTANGELCKQYANEGKLVPDSVIIAMVETYLDHITSDVVWDGFPRTVAQADALGDLLAKKGQQVDCVLLLDIAQDKLIARITGRISCPNCKKTYHVIYHKPKTEGICDSCHTALVQRPDDTLEKAKVRLETYDAETAPLINYYRAKGVLKVVDADRSSAAVWKEITEVLHG